LLSRKNDCALGHAIAKEMDARAKPIGGKISRSRVPDAVQRERQRSGAPLIRDLREGGVRNDPCRSGSPDLRAFER
jgi:hypothetical protein